MSPQRRAMLSQIMTMAWKKLRWERSVMGRTYTMSEALTHAWAWEKGAADRASAAAAWAAAPKPIVHLRSIHLSAIDRSLSARRYGKADAYRASYMTARLGY